jgi:hypothetical protein
MAELGFTAERVAQEGRIAVHAVGGEGSSSRV